jgi:dihydroorotate dehydrogenase electron transfer subunit
MNFYPRDTKAKILLHRKISPDYYRLRLLCSEIARLAQPGQFLMLRVTELRDPFLRRPFSFGRIFPPQRKKIRIEDEGVIEIYYQNVGRGTFLMTQLKEGQNLDIFGPLGQGFRKPEGIQRAILIGGGIGVAPLISWADELRNRGSRKKGGRKTPPEPPEVLVLIGGKNRDHVLGVQEFKKMGCDLQVATEDGSQGFQGMVTDLLEREVLTRGHTPTSLFACGPVPMLKKVTQIAEQFDLPCQVLLESRMACGIGACLGCAVKVRQNDGGEIFPKGKNRIANPRLCIPPTSAEEGGVEKMDIKSTLMQGPAFRYARVCKEGPVFEARKIIWE